MSASDERHPAWDLLEHDVAHQKAENFSGYYGERPGEHEIHLSTAISLKRIADALAPAGGDSVNHLLHQIALNGIPRQ